MIICEDERRLVPLNRTADQNAAAVEEPGRCAKALAGVVVAGDHDDGRIRPFVNALQEIAIEFHRGFRRRGLVIDIAGDQQNVDALIDDCLEHLVENVCLILVQRHASQGLFQMPICRVKNSHFYGARPIERYDPQRTRGASPLAFLGQGLPEGAKLEATGYLALRRLPPGSFPQRPCHRTRPWIQEACPTHLTAPSR